MDNAEFEALTTEEAFRKKVIDSFGHIRNEFAAMNERMSKQDAAIAQNTSVTERVAQETKVVREFMLNGAEAAKFFCRLAKAWHFMWRSFLIPIGATLLVIYALLYYAAHDTFPAWVVAVAHFFA